VKAMLEIPSTRGQTWIPRLAMVSLNGNEYVFVRKPRSPGNASKIDGKMPDKFERRIVQVAQENSDRVIIAHGLKPGEEIATNGSLILAQLYEDTMTVDTGMPAR
jgi:cobalt-zinc-cadmium efflux system membrane fusion protein